MAHTPGPWFVYGASRVQIIGTASRRLVCRVPDSEPMTEVQRADAHLIAAAPELLDFVKQVQSQHRPHGDRERCWSCGLDGNCCHHYSAATRLIAKAEGKQS